MINFLDNKYTKWYFSLVEKRKLSSPDSNHIEKHHIIPKSLGGSNKKDNIVSFSPREHYIAHLLLVKMTEGEDRMKMSFAIRCMTNFQNKYHNRYTPSSKIYSIAREYAIQATSIKNKGHPKYLKYQTEEAKKKISISMKEKLSKLTSEEKFKRSQNSLSSKKSWTTDRKEKISKALTGRVIPQDIREKMSLGKKELIKNLSLEEKKKKYGENNKGKTWKLVNGKRVWFAKEN